jgi:hypothetical protein
VTDRESPLIAIQYLENSPLVAGSVAEIAPDDARARLRAAFERLPISHVLLGWNLPDALVRACGEEAARAGAQLFCRHPLLAGDGSFVPQPEWQTVGLDGERVPGFRDLPEFTFVCPNRPAVREAALEHLRDAIKRGPYQGVFLDRIHYPSPAAAPHRWLACFCQDCRRAAAADGLDLEITRRQIEVIFKTPRRIPAFVQMLLDPQPPKLGQPNLATLHAFLKFRTRSVTRFVQAAAEVAAAEVTAVGFGCFSPALASMVGQDFGSLDEHCDWIKMMPHAHALGPSGLPFELGNLADWLVDRQETDESDAIEWLTQASRLPLPTTRADLYERGLGSEALAAEVRRGHADGASTLLAGIELVEAAPAQITANLQALCAAGADGLMLSWDLWHIPLERLDLVRQVWVE